MYQMEWAMRLNDLAWKGKRVKIGLMYMVDESIF